ncbi:hypothetical protein [Cyclobacterium jeungdonense]|uniref:Uncharacterized protein n=1 Tax=Cyclobacterium jeungdonense TaxID=708087 RepID=A0ABT8C820_9BACT|nr:hypothetical protein [Cyclobacterium jeungdonense]MDN3688502.1 hypothetical protein [Cyclobacterium jeungdonense]
MTVRIFGPYLLLFCGLIFGACETVEEKPRAAEGKLSIQLKQGLAGNEGSRLQQVPIQGVSHLVITILQENGAETAYSSKRIPLMKFQDEILIEEISLPPGSYQITDFYLTDSLETILYASPMEGSPFAASLNQPLPLDFQMRATGSAEIQMEVISTANTSPENFGFPSDLEGFKETFFFFLTLSEEGTDDYLDYLPGKLTVSIDDNSRTQPLGRSFNRIVLPKGAEAYVLLVESETYQSLKQTLSYDTLLQFAERPLILEMKKERSDAEFIGGVFEGSIALATQAQVDSFSRKGYDTIHGDLILGQSAPNESDPVTDLRGLSTIQEIQGNLSLIENPSLKSVMGLHQLQVISGTLTIQGNEFLESLADLFRLSYLRELRLIQNPNLRNFEGLQASTPSIAKLHIEAMEHFTSLDQLGRFRQMGEITITANPNLTQLSFNFLQEKIGIIQISDNPGLLNFGGPSSAGFTQINRLMLQNNKNLENLKGLLAPEGMVMKHFEFSNHPKIETLHDLAFYEYFSKITIQNNESLQDLLPFSPLTVLFSSITLVNNPKIQSLDGLHNINQVVYYPTIEPDAMPYPINPELFTFTDNASLTDFCGFADQIIEFGAGFSVIENNGYNPSLEDFINGDCNEEEL